MSNLFGSARLYVIALFIGQLLATTVYAEGRWIKLAPFPEPSEELLGAAAGGKMYAFAGLAPGWKPKGLVYEYDPASDKWTKKKPMALASHHVGLVEYRGKIYAFGGFVPPEAGEPAWVPINNAWEYDPVADTWKALAPMPTKRGSPVVAAVGNKIYVIGGATTPAHSNETAVHPARPHLAVGTVEEYDPATNTWRERTPMPTARNHAVTGAVNGKIYVIGGRVGAAFIGVASNTNVVEEYDPAADAWRPRTRMPTPRSAMAAGVHDGRIYVEGGEFQDSQMMATFRALEAYDPASNTWAVLPSMPVSRHGLAGGIVGNRLHMVSGDVQSAGTGVHVDSESHDAFEFDRGNK
ncbi:MAG TPA: kelch repeat-containing protein [Acidiferrobacterales bacterium]|nr:kelch repeat-containing protein [Acidiferrobacterales bacterium]